MADKALAERMSAQILLGRRSRRNECRDWIVDESREVVTSVQSPAIDVSVTFDNQHPPGVISVL